MSETEVEPRESIRRVVIEQGPETIQPPQFAFYQQVFDFVYLAKCYANNALAEDIGAQLTPKDSTDEIEEKLSQAEQMVDFNGDLIAIRKDLSANGTINQNVLNAMERAKENLANELNVEWPPEESVNQYLRKGADEFIKRDAALVSSDLHDNLNPGFFALRTTFESIPRLWEEEWKNLPTEEVEQKINEMATNHLTKTYRRIINDCNKLVENVITPPELKEMTVSDFVVNFKGLKREILNQIQELTKKLQIPTEDLRTLGIATPHPESKKFDQIQFDVITPSPDEIAEFGALHFRFYPQAMENAIYGIAQNTAKAYLSRSTAAEGGSAARIFFKKTTREDGRECVEIIFQDNGVGLPEGVDIIHFQDGLSYWPFTEKQKGEGTTVSKIRGTGTGSAAFAAVAKMADGDFFLRRPLKEEGAQAVFQLPILD